MVGVLYLNGHGVAADDSLAAAWFTKAAEQGNHDAQGHLALLYKLGRGVKRDLDRAYTWLFLSLEGTEHAEQNPALRDLAGIMSQREITEAEHRASEWRSTHQPSPPLDDIHLLAAH